MNSRKTFRVYFYLLVSSLMNFLKLEKIITSSVSQGIFWNRQFPWLYWAHINGPFLKTICFCVVNFLAVSVDGVLFTYEQTLLFDLREIQWLDYFKENNVCETKNIFFILVTASKFKKKELFLHFVYFSCYLGCLILYLSNIWIDCSSVNFVFLIYESLIRM